MRIRSVVVTMRGTVARAEVCHCLILVSLAGMEGQIPGGVASGLAMWSRKPKLSVCGGRTGAICYSYARCIPGWTVLCTRPVPLRLGGDKMG